MDSCENNNHELFFDIAKCRFKIKVPSLVRKSIEKRFYSRGIAHRNYVSPKSFEVSINVLFALFAAYT